MVMENFNWEKRLERVSIEGLGIFIIFSGRLVYRGYETARMTDILLEKKLRTKRRIIICLVFSFLLFFFSSSHNCILVTGL